MRRRRFCARALLAVALLACTANGAQAQQGYGPGQRVLLDAHNAYPDRGRFADRIDRALATGVPVAIEQDLFSRRNARTGRLEVVVAHEREGISSAPTLEAYFFEKIRPIMERALQEQRRDTWPLIVLNLDFKSNDRVLLDATFALLGRYASWLTTAPRTKTPDRAEPLTAGPLLVLTGSNTAHRKRFHDARRVGERLLVFGAIAVPEGDTSSDEAREASLLAMEPERIIPSRASNFARWVNFPWLVVEAGGPTKAAAWTAGDSVRLHALVRRAHTQQLWIRFYTLDGFAPGDGDGLTRSYNFGTVAAAQTRWRAATGAGVDFIATDHYEAFNKSASTTSPTDGQRRY